MLFLFLPVWLYPVFCTLEGLVIRVTSGRIITRLVFVGSWPLGMAGLGRVSFTKFLGYVVYAFIGWRLANLVLCL